MNILAIAQSGMSAAEARLDVAAQNTVAASGSEPSQAGGTADAAPTAALNLVQYSLADGGTATQVQAHGSDEPVMDMLNQMQAILAFQANVRAFQAGEKMLATTLSLSA